MRSLLWQVRHGVWDDLAELFRLRPQLTAEERADVVLCFWEVNG